MRRFIVLFFVMFATAVQAEDDALLDEIRKLRGEVRSLSSDIRGIGDRAAPPVAVNSAASADVSISRLPPPANAYDLWSFKPLQKPGEPVVKQQAWPRSDLDRFILKRLEAADIQPNADADRTTLARRVSFDLTGLPPSESDVEAFVNDPAEDDDALARLVDGYLASPRFGERWGRHWLDVVRYADSVGRTWNAPFTYAWRYRDYVIEAFNRDTPFDRLIAEQLAGDLLPARSVEERRRNLTATGFLALGSLALNDGRLEGFRMDRIDDQIDVTTRAFLGLTVSCARCHDHKYDPVTMRDYYALAGIFHSTQTLPGQGHQQDMGGGGYVDAERLIRLPSAEGTVREELVPGVHTMNEFRDAWSRLRDEARYTTDPDVAMGALEGKIRDCELRIKGDAYDRDEAPPRGEVHIDGLPGLPPIPADASGRLQLAQWIASPENPLTARVMANRVWRHLFGHGLVSTMDNFGVNGAEPSHPELLDHLALKFVEGGWSVKGLIRTIVLSRTYRLASTGNEAAAQVDVQNALYWRHDMRRLEVEALRDSLLHLAGRLETEPPYGIQVAGMGGKGKGGVVRSLLSTDAPYRTVYLPVLRSLVPAVYSTFDFPDPCQISGQREVTTVAPQALFFMNGSFVHRCAQDMADQVLQKVSDPTQRVQAIYRSMLARTATAEELNEALKFVDELEPPSSTRDAELYRWTTLVQALLAGGEFRYVL